MNYDNRGYFIPPHVDEKSDIFKDDMLFNNYLDTTKYDYPERDPIFRKVDDNRENFIPPHVDENLNVVTDRKKYSYSTKY